MGVINNKIFLIFVLLGLLFTATACSLKNIEDVKNDGLIGKKVAVRGIVGETIKIGSFSGYTLQDDTGSIGVVSKDLPDEGTRKTVRGTLRKLFVYYIEVE
jgi:hypothetical protein